MCSMSVSESGYLKRNIKGPTQERKHFSAPNVTGVFQHHSSKFTRGLTGERNDLGGPNVTRVSLSQNTERIIIGALQVHSALQTIPHKGFLKRQERTHKLRLETLQVHNVW